MSRATTVKWLQKSSLFLMSESLTAVNMSVKHFRLHESKPWNQKRNLEPGSLVSNYKPVWVKETKQDWDYWIGAEIKIFFCVLYPSTIRKLYLFPVASVGPAVHFLSWKTKRKCVCVWANISRGVFVMAVINVSLVNRHANTGEQWTLAAAIPIWLN